MKSRMLLAGALLTVALVAIGCTASEPRRTSSSATRQSGSPAHATSRTQGQTAHAPSVSGPAATGAVASDPHGHPSDPHGHGHDHSTDRVPAFEIDPASLKSLPPTLSPELFAGKQKLAYQVVKQIPKTIAQLPCYCYCDRGFGHKSLHSCFVDDHAAHCAVCVDEALMAYQMEKEGKFSPAQIRERIVAQYSAAQ